MTGLDAGFLYMETPSMHMHTLKIAVVDASGAPSGYSFAEAKRVLRERIHLLPPFRRRVVPVPLGVHHPVWLEDPDFDLEYHVRRIGCPAPGGPRELCEMISDIAGRPLDRTRPLWELWVVEGLEGGRVGFVAKIHHAVADGMAAAALLANVMDGIEPPPADGWRPDRIPTPARLFRDAARDLATDWRGLVELLRRTFAALFALRRHRRTAETTSALPFTAPRTPFNRALTPHRSFVYTTLSMADVKAVRNAFGVTVNDVVLATVAGALRRYLNDHGGVPAKPLVAGVPTATSTEPRLGGNRVSNMFVQLPTHLEDPAGRLRAVAASSKAAKQTHALLGPDMLAEWSQRTPPRPFSWFMRLYSRKRWASRHRPPINLVVSNVPGPPETLSIVGARLETLSSVGPILEGIGLNVTCWSYVGELNAGILACRELVADPWAIADGMRDALDELRKAAVSA